MVIKGRIDDQGRIVIPKDVREKWNLKGEVEIVEVEGGVLIRPKKSGWEDFLSRKVKVDWNRAIAVSLEKVSVDELIFGVP
ncbi:MAG: AbrB/MazE/SpoVT family DNA-binding domain-containing protein [Candidatus Freyarchaeota archaeon]|nr:AbrB/MazE/SpoVT family DNA-binding domain-containing protein [Candidatus Jordarchaeia archaeon]MBS7267585.1 AbrB/MazE/SpoVT family DNA-binding domain-containing protein [Candidatus Jordarchaeia archaeon]MBS7278792.1 AbrB/MazE/SpoVT family DNA-binding domain-containing protein [Candidatus Jordarchaeia archaeon]